MRLFLALFSLLWLTSWSIAEADPPNLDLMLSRVGEHETAGHNRSPFIDSVNRFVGVPLGSPYCAATVSWCNAQAGVTSPRPTGLAIRLKTAESFSVLDVLNGRDSIRAGDIIIWQKGRTMQGHCGLAIRQLARDRILEVEANTSCHVESDDREGDGICTKLRWFKRACYFGPKWITRPVFKLAALDSPPHMVAMAFLKSTRSYGYT